MQGQSQQQAYDRGSTIFSPDGRLYQVEYAREAVKRGSPSIGVRTADGVVLLVAKRLSSPLMEAASVEKIHKVDDHVGVASAGHVADARQLVDFARRNAQVSRLRYGEPIGVEALTKDVTDHVQQYTQVGGARPFGVALLVAGIDGDGRPRLFETDPSGTPYEWKALVVGEDRSEVQTYLEDEYEPELDLTDGVGLALRALGEVREHVTPDAVGVATVDAESRSLVRLTDDEVAEYLEEYGLLADGDSDEEPERDGEPD
ncbi:archaeal proteasome endopeptidase complex subunit alpha [Halobacterium rubrum]|uniref:archaeal proteasome endopeptidase complex subunit alpha n=1 Tax=Halobacterium TaxID=2239 RepID=UPI001EFFB685|nr:MULTISPECIES: archaeal proteasome endopeptidase complex subunit alpha [Halobacterium]MDH5020037.1 archaeal proteasome endopeptidase complex subunit alpha [Halobacterium rubrum]